MNPWKRLDEVVAFQLFRQAALKHRVKVPPVKEQVPDPYLPSGLEQWEPGEEIAGIDWRASVAARGPMAAAAPLLRQFLPDDPDTTRVTPPSVEIYLDTSGSMPDPLGRLKEGPRKGMKALPEDCPMTVAALIIALSCLRVKGRVRGVVWSSDTCVARTWMREEERVLKFFLQSQQQGTDFPFEQFEALSKESGPARGAIRVIVSDSDLLSTKNWGHDAKSLYPHNLRIIQEVAKRSERVVLLLANVDKTTAKAYEAMSPKITVAIVQGHDGLPKLAANIADALFGKKQKNTGKRQGGGKE